MNDTVETYYNLKKLIRLQVSGVQSQKSWFIEHKKKRWYNKKGRYYFTATERFFLFKDSTYLGETEEDIRKNIPAKYVYIDGEIYYSPDVHLKFEGGISQTFYFSTDEQAKTYCDNLIEKCKDLGVDITSLDYIEYEE